MAEIKYEVEKHIGLLSEGSNGSRKEINMVSWNDRPAKYDIRDWDENHEKMGKGITLSETEMHNLVDLINNN